jgi:HNH endonuclease
MWEATCEACGASFSHPRSQGKRRYCSAACAGNANTKTKLVCQWCGGDYVGRPHERRFCSRPCFYGHQSANANGTIDKAGYRRIRVDGAYVYEQRHVMEAAVGHPIPPESTVHHKNGDKLDNRPDNLELWASRHPKGQRVLDLLEYARWILDTFGADEARLRELEG